LRLATGDLRPAVGTCDPTAWDSHPAGGLLRPVTLGPTSELTVNASNPYPLR
jgi:hypothetical protein